MPEGISSMRDKHGGLTRRSFLKTTAIAAGTVAVGSTALAGCSSIGAGTAVPAAEDEGQIITTRCNGSCYGGCRLNLLVKDGKILRITAGDPPDAGFSGSANPKDYMGIKDVYKGICLRGPANLQRTYDPVRLKYPMKRVGERGEDKWEQISWDEAINTIAEKWNGYRREFGDHSIFFVGYGGDAPSATLFSRLSSLMNTSTITMGVDMANIMWSIKVMGASPFASGNEWPDMLHSKCLILWGVNPTHAQLQLYKFMTGAKKNGAQIISVNPNCSYSTYRSDLHLPLRPGSDAALAFAMTNIVLREHWEDEDFLRKSTVAPYLVKSTDKKFLRMSDLGIEPTEGPINPMTGQPTVIDPPVVWDESINDSSSADEAELPSLHSSKTINGIQVTTAFDLLIEQIREYTPEKAAELCDIPSEMIEKTARMYAQNSPATIYTMFGFDHYTNGHYGYWATMILAAVTGNLGKRGATGAMAVGNQVQTVSLSVYPPPPTDPGPSIGAPVMVEALENGSYQGISFTPKALFIRGNAFNSAERPKWIEAYNKFEFIVVCDTGFTDPARLLADIILPGSFWFEKPSLACYFTPYLDYQPQAIDPLFDSKSEFDIAKLLANALGYTGQFEDSVDEIMEQVCNGQFIKSQGITYEALKKAGSMRVIPYSKDGGPFIYGEEGIFNTPTGRVEFYQESPTPTMDYGQTIDYDNEHLPHFEPPTEAWEDNPLREKYPISCFQAHERWRVHSSWAWCQWLREIDTEPVVKLSKSDAESRGINTGDKVKVYNDRGDATLKAIIDNGLRPGMLNIPHGWHQAQYIDGYYNNLTSLHHNPICVNGCFSDTLVQVEKL